jgi:hypothetical protein
MSGIIDLFIYSGVDKDPTDHAPREGSGSGTPPPPQIYRILKFVDTFGMDSVRLTEGSIPDTCYDVCE